MTNTPTPISPTAYALGIDLLSRRVLSVSTDRPAYIQGATALITAYDPRDTLEQTWGEYLVGYAIGPRGGVRRVEI